jgi:hypothetical protein
MDYWRGRGRAQQDLCAEYPGNLAFLNDLASLSWRLKRRVPCAWAMERLKGGPEDRYWSADEYSQATKWLSSGMDDQTRI